MLSNMKNEKKKYNMCNKKFNKKGKYIINYIIIIIHYILKKKKKKEAFNVLY